MNNKKVIKRIIIVIVIICIALVLYLLIDNMVMSNDVNNAISIIEQMRDVKKCTIVINSDTANVYVKSYVGKYISSDSREYIQDIIRETINDFKNINVVVK